MPERSIPNVFADGVADALIGPSVIKLTFFSTMRIDQQSEENVEQREMNLQLTMPTAVWIELIASLADNVRMNMDNLLGGLHTQAAEIQKLHDRVTKSAVST